MAIMTMQHALDEVETIMLEKLRLSKDFSFPRMYVRATYDMMRDQIITSFCTEVGSQTIENVTLTVSYPATWWDHFKYSCFPRWAKKRWPPAIKVVEQRYDVKAVYPNIAFPEDEHYITVIKRYN